MELVMCDLCGGRSATCVARQTDVIHRSTDEYFSIVRCDTCGLCYTNPRPTQGEIGRYYTETYAFFQTSSAFLQIIRRLLMWFANSPLAPLASVVPRLGRILAVRVMPAVPDPVMTAFNEGIRGGLLDIGCGSGIHANFWGHSGALMAYRRVMPVAGVEVSEEARRVLGTFGIESWPNIEEVPADRQWPLIRMNWSLEHVHRPSAFFKFILDHLAPGGRAIVCVPNYEGLLYKLAPDSVELPIHLYHFSPRDIYAYAAKYRLRVRDLRTFSYPGMFFSAVDLGMLDPRFATNAGIVESRRFQKTLSRFDRAGFGNDMIVVLER